MSFADQIIENSEQTFAYMAKSHTQTVLIVNKHRELIDVLESYGVYASAGTDYLFLGCAGDTKKLYDVLGIIKQHRYVPDAENTVSDEKTTEWRGKFRKGKDLIQFSFTSTVCRKVQVGVQMVEMPVFEIECGEPPVVEVIDFPPPAVQESELKISLSEPFDSDDKIPF